MSQGNVQQPQPVPPVGASPVEPHDSKTMAMLCHLLGLVGFLGPLIIWLIKKDESELVNDQGKEALNFQLTILIAFFVSIVLCFVLIGFLLLPAVWIFDIVMIIIASMKANSGIRYRYPLCIRFIK